MAKIRKRTWRLPSGKVRTAWQVTWVDQLCRRRSKQFSSQAEARQWLESNDLRSANTVPEVRTVADAGRAWIDRADSNGLERSTMESYERALAFILPYIGAIPLAELTQGQVIAFRKELASAKTPDTAERTLHILKMMLGNAGFGNVAGKLRSSKSPRHRQALRRKITIPTRADYRTLITLLKERVEALRKKRVRAIMEKDPKKRKKLEDRRNMAERNLPLFETLFETGVRPSELRGLPWAQVKFERGAIEVLQRVDKYNAMGACKTDASYRHIPVSEHLLSDLRAWQKICPPSAQDLVFPTASGKPMSLRNLQREFGRLQTAAGVTKVVVGTDGKQRRGKKYMLKDCRHGAASWWIRKRIDLKDLTTRMGHSSIQVTFDVYGHVIEDVEASGVIMTDSDDDLYVEATSTQQVPP